VKENQCEKGPDRINNTVGVTSMLSGDAAGKQAICALLQQSRPLYYALNPVLRLQCARKDVCIKYKI